MNTVWLLTQGCAEGVVLPDAGAQGARGERSGSQAATLGLGPRGVGTQGHGVGGWGLLRRSRLDRADSGPGSRRCDASGGFSCCWAPLEPRWLLLVMGGSFEGVKRSGSGLTARSRGPLSAALSPRCPLRAAAGLGIVRLLTACSEKKESLGCLLTCSQGHVSSSWLSRL